MLTSATTHGAHLSLNLQVDSSPAVQTFRCSGHLLSKRSDGVVIYCPIFRQSGHLLSKLPDGVVIYCPVFWSSMVREQASCDYTHMYTSAERNTNCCIPYNTHTTYLCVNRRVTYVTVCTHIHSPLRFTSHVTTACVNL